MKEFVKLSILLSLYGIFKEFRPSEPYIMPYLTGPLQNFTYEEVTGEIYPVSVYSTLLLLVVVFLVTDYLRYKKIIILQAISNIITYLMLIFCRGVFQMQLMQAVYGMMLASEVGYFTYLYAKVDTDQFQKVTSYTRSAHLIGKSLSGIVSQIGVFFDPTYLSLFWITVGSNTVSLIFACTLHSVDKSMYFHRHTVQQGAGNDSTENKVERQDCSVVARFLWNDLTAAFTNMYVVKWAAWWVLASGGYFMYISYIQLLWDAVREESADDGLQLNGVVETTYTLLGALGSLVIGRVSWNWRKLGEPLLTLCSLVTAGLMYIMSASYSVYVVYIAYVLSTTIFQVMITVANSEVAKSVNRESYGLVFGVTTFALYIVLSLFTYILLQVFEAGIRTQFQVYAVYYAVLGLCFGVVVILRVIFNFKSKSYQM